MEATEAQSACYQDGEGQNGDEDGDERENNCGDDESGGEGIDRQIRCNNRQR